MIEEMDTGEILNYQLKNVYQNPLYKDQGIQLTFEGYLHCIFDNIKLIIGSKTEKRIFLNEIFFTKSNSKSTNNKFV